MTEKKYSDAEKLQLLISHWLEHNENHTSEYLQWAGVARQAGKEEAAKFIEQAVELLKKADISLKNALDSVGGPPSGGHHHHHHD